MEDRRAVSRQGQEQGRGAGQRVPPGMPRIRAALDRRADRRVQASRGHRRFRQPVPDDEFPRRGAHRRRTDEVRHVRPTLSRFQAGNVERSRAHRTGRGRSRISGLRERHDLGEVSDSIHVARRRADEARTFRCLCRHLDDHPLDHPRQPGRQLFAAHQLWALRDHGGRKRFWPATGREADLRRRVGRGVIGPGKGDHESASQRFRARAWKPYAIPST